MNCLFVAKKWFSETPYYTPLRWPQPVRWLKPSHYYLTHTPALVKHTTYIVHTYTHTYTLLGRDLTTFMTSQELLHVVMDVLSVRESNLVMIHYVLVLVGTGLEFDHVELEWTGNETWEEEVDHSFKSAASPLLLTWGEFLSTIQEVHYRDVVIRPGGGREGRGWRERERERERRGEMITVDGPLLEKRYSWFPWRLNKHILGRVYFVRKQVVTPSYHSQRT